MQIQDAVKEARIAALLHGGKWYAVEKRHNFSIVRADEYHTKLGRVVGTFTPESVKASTPESFPQGR